MLLVDSNHLPSELRASALTVKGKATLIGMYYEPDRQQDMEGGLLLHLVQHSSFQHLRNSVKQLFLLITKIASLDMTI